MQALPLPYVQDRALLMVGREAWAHPTFSETTRNARQASRISILEASLRDLEEPVPHLKERMVDLAVALYSLLPSKL